MKEIFFALQLRGQSAVSAEDPKLIRSTTIGVSSNIITSIDPDGVAGRVQASAGEGAACETEVVMTGEHTFTEKGVLTFGNAGHSLRFSSVGEGYIGPSPVPGVLQGAVMWRVDEGTGQFEGAQGLITSNYTVTSKGEVVDHQFGVIFVKK